MPYYLNDKLDITWYDVSIMDMGDFIRICLICSDLDKGTKFFTDLIERTKRQPTFIAIERQDKGHDLIIDDNVDRFFKLQTKLTYKEYPSFKYLRQRDKEFRIFLVTEEKDGNMIANGFGFVPMEVHYITDVDELLKKFENPVRWN